MQDQTVLITGASRGIGKSTALLFASKGFRVFLNCKNSVDALKELQHTIQETYHTDCHIVPGDVGDPSCVRDIFQKISQVCEGVDILINNAGIATSDFLWICRTKIGTGSSTPIFLPSFTAAGPLSPYGLPAVRTDHQYFLYVGDLRRLL